MPCQTSEELQHLVELSKKYAVNGKVADYIPELGKANPNDLSIAIHYPDGRCISAEISAKKFTLQKHL